MGRTIFYLLVICFLGVFNNVLAQNESQGLDERKKIIEQAQASAEDQTNKMKEVLDLSEQQTREVENINYFHGKQLKESCREMSGERIASRYDKIQYARDNALENVLNDEQFEAYLNLKENEDWITLDSYKAPSPSNEGENDSHFTEACLREDPNNDMGMNYGNMPLIDNSSSEVNSKKETEGISLRKRSNSNSSPMPEEGFDNIGYSKAMREAEVKNSDNNDDKGKKKPLFKKS